MSAAGAHEAHDEHHAHSPFIQHHYDDAQHQFDSGKLGIWLFLAQEVLFFSALFVAYILYRIHHPEIYSYAHKYLDVKYGAINTGVLIFSSLTAAWAVRAAQLNQRKRLIGCIVVTIMCALGFLCIKYIEYSHKVHEHILFGRYFDPCVSSGGNELLTKRNECPGSKSTVVWSYDNAAPLTGCYPDFTIDQDVHKEGVQASCKVREVKLELRSVKQPDGSEREDEKELEAKPIANQCPEEVFGEHEAMGEKSASKTQHEEKEKLPCWKSSRQPAVCKPGWFFQWTCQGKCDRKLTGGAGGVAGPYANQQKCVEGRGDKESAMKGEKDTYTLFECGPSDASGILVVYEDKEERGEISRTVDVENMGKALGIDLLAKLTAADGVLADPKAKPEDKTKASEDKRRAAAAANALRPGADQATIEQLGKDAGVAVPIRYIIVEYREIADCAGPPKATAAGEIDENRLTPLVVGKKGVQPVHEMTVHEEHEREAMGPPPEHTNMFFTIYFAMTGLHGVHVLFGVFVFIWLLIRSIKGHFTPEYFGPIDYAALYWHIVDLIWIFLFPLLYLIH